MCTLTSAPHKEWTSAASRGPTGTPPEDLFNYRSHVPPVLRHGFLVGRRIGEHKQVTGWATGHAPLILPVVEVHVLDVLECLVRHVLLVASLRDRDSLRSYIPNKVQRLECT